MSKSNGAPARMAEVRDGSSPTEEALRFERVQRCAVEVKAVLDRCQCRLVAHVVIRDGQVGSQTEIVSQ